MPLGSTEGERRREATSERSHKLALWPSSAATAHARRLALEGVPPLYLLSDRTPLLEHVPEPDLRPTAAGKRTRAGRLPSRETSPARAAARSLEQDHTVAAPAHDLAEESLAASFRPDLDLDGALAEPAAAGNAGLPIPRSLLASVGALTGFDLSSVRVQESGLPSSVGAVALARGAELHFAPGHYDPQSPTGLELLAHELVHVAQQARGQVRPDTRTGGVELATEPAHEREADDLARRAVAAASTTPAPLATGGRAPLTFAEPPPAQRKLATYKDVDLDQKGRANWESLHPSFDDDGVATGRGATAKGKNVSRDWTTQVRWDECQHDDGVKMVAKLGPDHGLGSDPGSGKRSWNRRVHKLHLSSGGAPDETKRYVAGHLLSAQLGGPGDDERNLAPIPRDANSQHETQVEHHVKRLVNELHGWVHYAVEVTHADDKGVKYPAKLACTWWQLDPTMEAGQEVAGTKAERTFAIEPPSKYDTNGGKGVPGPELAKEATELHPDTARTVPALGDLILDTPTKVKARALAMRPLADKLESLGTMLTPEQAESLLRASTPSEEELGLYEQLAKLTSPEEATNLRDDLPTLLGGLHQRIKLRHDKANELRPGKDGDAVHRALQECQQREQVAHKHLADLVSNLIDAVKRGHKEATNAKEDLGGHVNALRAWLGEPPLLADQLDVRSLVALTERRHDAILSMGRPSTGGTGQSMERLINMATELGLPTTGPKAELASHLSKHHSQQELQSDQRGNDAQTTCQQFTSFANEVAAGTKLLPALSNEVRADKTLRHLAELAASKLSSETLLALAVAYAEREGKPALSAMRYLIDHSRSDGKSEHEDPAKQKADLQEDETEDLMQEAPQGEKGDEAPQRDESTTKGKAYKAIEQDLESIRTQTKNASWAMPHEVAQWLLSSKYHVRRKDLLESLLHQLEREKLVAKVQQ